MEAESPGPALQCRPPLTALQGRSPPTALPQPEKEPTPGGAPRLEWSRQGDGKALQKDLCKSPSPGHAEKCMPDRPSVSSGLICPHEFLSCQEALGEALPHEAGCYPWVSPILDPESAHTKEQIRLITCYSNPKQRYNYVRVGTKGKGWGTPKGSPTLNVEAQLSHASFHLEPTDNIGVP